MIGLREILQIVINGLLIGGVYGLAALGLSLIWGVMKVVNLAHGAFIMLGAYVSYWAFKFLGLHPLVSIVLGLFIGLGVGILIYRSVIDRIIASASNDFEMEMMTLLFTFAVSIILYGAALNVWGADIRGIPIVMPPLSVVGIEIPTSRLATFVVAVICGVILQQFLKRTYLGKAIRAVMQSRDVSMLSGINPAKIFAISFSIGVGYAMVAGVLISLVSPVTPFLGYFYLLKCFTVVALGGLGNPIGAFAAGLILGLAESATTLFASFALSPAVAFILLIVILIVRPTGLFGAVRER